MAEKKKQNEMSITLDGYVEAVELENGSPGVMIYDGEDDYAVVMDKTGKKLLDHVDEEIEVSGLLSKRQGELILKVIQFRIIDLYEDWDDDDYSDYEFDNDDDRWIA